MASGDECVVGAILNTLFADAPPEVLHIIAAELFGTVNTHFKMQHHQFPL
jgi:hypothetical protein